MHGSTRFSVNLILLLFFAVAHLFTTNDSRAQDKIRIGISSTSPGFLPTVVAEQRGFFSDRKSVV